MQTAFLLVMLIAGGLLILMFLLQQIAEILDHVIQGPLSFLDNLVSSLHGGDADVTIDVSHDTDVDVHPLSVRTVLGFLTFFGATGYLLTSIQLSMLIVVPIALVIGWVGGWLIWKFTRWVFSQSSSSHISDTDYLGREGSVLLSIPPDRFGEVSVNIRGFVVSGPARSASLQEIPKGANVVITAKEGGIFTVTPVSEKLYLKDPGN